MGSGSAVTGGADGKVLVWDIRRKVSTRLVDMKSRNDVLISVKHILGARFSVIGTLLLLWQGLTTQMQTCYQ